MFAPSRKRNAITSVGKINRHIVGGYNDGVIANSGNYPKDLKFMHVQIKDLESQQYLIDYDLTQRLIIDDANKDFLNNAIQKMRIAGQKKKGRDLTPEEEKQIIQACSKNRLYAFDFMLPLNEDNVFVPSKDVESGYKTMRLVDRLKQLSAESKKKYQPEWNPTNNLLFRLNKMGKGKTMCSSNNEGKAIRWFDQNNKILAKSIEVACNPWFNEDGKEDGCWYYNQGQCKRNYKLFLDVKGLSNMGHFFIESTTSEFCDNYRKIVEQIADITYSAYGYPITTNVPIRMIMYTKTKNMPVNKQNPNQPVQSKIHTYYDFVIPSGDQSVAAFVLERTKEVAKSINMFKTGMVAKFETDEIDDSNTHAEFSPGSLNSSEFDESVETVDKSNENPESTEEKKVESAPTEEVIQIEIPEELKRKVSEKEKVDDLTGFLQDCLDILDDKDAQPIRDKFEKLCKESSNGKITKKKAIEIIDYIRETKKWFR